MKSDVDEGELSMLLEKVYKERGWDFRNYKRSSLKRRISKRLQAHGLTSIKQYIGLLDKDPGEYAHLFSTITIKVSEFFREPGVFDYLGRAVEDSFSGPGGLRAWCCGCAFGEEAYSLAILLDECLDAGAVKNTKVFATDIDSEAIDRARRAEYPEDYLSNVSADLRQRHFITKDGGYKVKYNIRNLVKFGVLDIVRDSAISRIDVLFCRNLFIYFNKPLQEKVFAKLDYSLKPGGLIVLGKAEVLPARFARRYEAVGTDLNIYRKTAKAQS